MVAVLCKNAMNKKWLSAIAAGTAFSALQKCIFATHSILATQRTSNMMQKCI
jgi:hypothetical protein